jgi:hypothetical protein
MDQPQSDTDVPSKPVASVTPVDSNEALGGDSDGIDRLSEDLVLHEGDGKISRPIKPIPTHPPTSLTKKKRDATRDNSSTFQKLKDINRSTSHTSIHSNSDSLLEASQPATDETNLPTNSDAKTSTANVATRNTISASQRNSAKSPPRLDEATTKRTQTNIALSSQDKINENSKEILHRFRRKSGFVAQDSDLSQDGFGLHHTATVPAIGSTNGSHHHQLQQQEQLTRGDIEIFQRLEDEYGRALEEREVGYNARYTSVRQSAFLSIFFLLAYMIQGTVVFMNQTEWSIHESLFFSIFTITTVGYGREDLPTTPAFQAYTIFYIMIGVAALTIVVRYLHCICQCRFSNLGLTDNSWFFTGCSSIPMYCFGGIQSTTLPRPDGNETAWP